MELFFRCGGKGWLDWLGFCWVDKSMGWDEMKLNRIRKRWLVEEHAVWWFGGFDDFCSGGKIKNICR